MNCVVCQKQFITPEDICIHPSSSERHIIVMNLLLQEGTTLALKPFVSLPFDDPNFRHMRYARVNNRNVLNSSCGLTFCATLEFKDRLLSGIYSDDWIVRNWIFCQAPKLKEETIVIEPYTSRLSRVD